MIIGIFGLALTVRADDLPQIAAASSLQFVMPVLIEAFQRESDFAPRLTYGSSGNFQRQISQGAPFELFMSADESYVTALNLAGLTKDKGKVYAFGQLAVIRPGHQNPDLNGNLSFIREAIASGKFGRFAIANPDHAPYGRAAREALIALDLWGLVQPYLVRGENASQALQFALSGSSQGGLVPYALTFAAAIRARAQFHVIDSGNHQPIRQRMVLMKNSGDRARRFYEFIASKPAQQIFESYGYLVPSRTNQDEN